MKLNVLFLTAKLILLQNSGFSQENLTVSRVKDFIQNGQLVYFTKHTPLVDGYNMTYVNFCSDGTYFSQQDGSITVKGPQGTSQRNNRVYGTSYNENSGTWDVVKRNNLIYLEAINQSNQITYYLIDWNNLYQGKWIAGRTTYIFTKGNAMCR